MPGIAENRGSHRPFASETTAIDPQSCPLSFAQQRLWFLEQLNPGTPVYNIPQAWRLSGPLDLSAWQRALNELVARHETLRTTFHSIQGRPAQCVAPFQPRQFPVTDVSQVADAAAAARRVVDAEARQPFDLAVGPLFRVHTVRLSAVEHIVVFTLHHIIADAQSFDILRRELGSWYEAFAAGRTWSLPELPIQYLDYAAWEREQAASGAWEKDVLYWQQQLAGELPALEWPADAAPPARRTHHGASEPFSLPAPLTVALRAIGRAHGATLFMVLLAAFKAFLHRCTGQADIVVGTPVSTRNREELEGVVGMFINTVALRTPVGDDPSFAGLLARVRETACGAFAHADLPFDELIKAIRPDRGAESDPLLQAVFALQPGFPAEWLIGDLRASLVDVDTASAKFDWTLLLEEADCGIQGRLEYNTDLFEAETIKRLLRQFRFLLDGIAADPNRRLSEIPLLTGAERRQLVEEWSGAESEYERGASVQEIFAAQARLRPDAPALVFEERQWSYAELDRRSDELARWFRAAGVRPGTLAGLCVERSFDLIAAMLGILKAGGAYVPLDPSYPAERLQFMVADTAAAVLVTDSRSRHVLAPADASLRVVCVDEPAENPDDSEPLPKTGAEDLAYVMYTSGSTGTPKGVAVTHRGIVRLVRKTNYVTLSPSDIFLQLAPISFDASTFEIWACLLNGGKLVLFPPHTPSLEELGRAIRRHQVSVLWLTAGLFHQMIDSQAASLGSVRQLLAGGDVLSVPHVLKTLRELPGCRLINGYGPTENTTFTCCHRVPRDWAGGRSVPIGRPISNTRVFILDDHFEPVPVGIAGELCIAGDGLARGYWNRKELTEEKFVTCRPAGGGSTGVRVYRTGDRARWLADGTVEFLGRKDQQVKIRGFRIEPGEIEAVLARHPSVRAAAVIAREEKPGTRELIGYLVPQPGAVVDGKAMREFVAGKLPPHMVPAAWVMLDEMPLTANGKVDRRVLPAPQWQRSESAVAPRSGVEQQVAAIWHEVLGRDAFGVHDNFFHIGGHSLLATQVISRILRTFEVELPLRTLFEAPTIAGLAEAITNAPRRGAARPGITRRIPRTRAARLLAGLDQLSDAEVERLLGTSEIKTVAP
jgi:amino acid adenylation domain-containing protein